MNKEQKQKFQMAMRMAVDEKLAKLKDDEKVKVNVVLENGDVKIYSRIVPKDLSNRDPRKGAGWVLLFFFHFFC